MILKLENLGYQILDLNPIGYQLSVVISNQSLNSLHIDLCKLRELLSGGCSILPDTVGLLSLVSDMILENGHTSFHTIISSVLLQLQSC